MSREKRMMNRKKSNIKNNKKIEKENRTIKEHVTNIVGNKKLLITMIITILVLVTLLSGSFAMFMRSDESDKKDLYESGTLVIDFDDEKGEVIDLNPAKPMTDEYAIRTIKPYTFTITNTGTTNASYEVKLNETIENNKLSNKEVKKYIRYQIDDESPKTLSNLGSNIIVRGGIGPEDTLEFKLKLWIDIDAPNDMEGTTYKAIVSASGKATNRMQPNGPELADGMIPVTYDEKNDTWVKADTSTAWYNYEKQEWANAVTVTSETRETYLSNESGTPINIEDINTMWVWIPRYKYRIPESIGIGTKTPPEIDVVFESRTNTTGVTESVYRSSIQDDGTIDDSFNEDKKIYYTHPAFRDGTKEGNYKETAYDIGGWDKELTGIWYSKFQTSGTFDNPTIIPNKVANTGSGDNEFRTSLKFANGTFDNSLKTVNFIVNKNNEYGLNTKNNTTDTHMSKNTEWGMVAALSQSRYGKMGNKDFENENKEIYINNSSSLYTGRSGGTPTMGGVGVGTYSYNDNLCLSEDIENCTGEKEKNKGTGASTTGSIYGAYDMSGCGWPNMAAYNNAQVFTEKYCEKYDTSLSIKEMSKLGDFMWESKGWYSDSVSPGWNWVGRGGASTGGASSGIFNVDGSMRPAYSFRSVLIP